MHLDVASGGELHVALAAGVPPDRLVLHGNNKSTDELAAALELGVGRIVVDSFDEIARLGRPARVVALGAGPAPGPRPGDPRRRGAHPRVRAHRARRTPSSASRSPPAPRPRRSPRSSCMPGVELVGVHAHIGSQVFDASSFEQAAEVLGAFFAPLGLPELVVGGGLGVAYVNGESRPDPGRVGRGHPGRLRPGGRRPGHPDHGRARALHRRHRRLSPSTRSARSSTSPASAPT